MKIRANHICIHYEKAGTGTPLIMLHGNGESGKIFEPAAAVLKNRFTVYLPDSRCHGSSEKTDRLSYEWMAEDLFCFIQALGIQKPCIYGFSDGGIVALLLAANHPEIPAAIIVSGANTTPKGLKPAVRTGMRLRYLLTKDIKTKMMLTEPHITEEMLSKITAPALITCGEYDMIKRSDTLRIARSIPHAQLKIIKKEGHGSYIVGSKKIAQLIMDYTQQIRIR